MQDPALTSPMMNSNEEDYITIVAPTIDEVMQQFRVSELAAQGYCIAGRVGRHKFSYAGDADTSELFDGDRMVAATFIRTSSFG